MTGSMQVTSRRMPIILSRRPAGRFGTTRDVVNDGVEAVRTVTHSCATLSPLDIAFDEGIREMTVILAEDHSEFNVDYLNY